MNQSTKSSSKTKPQEVQTKQTKNQPTQESMLGLNEGQLTEHNSSMSNQTALLSRLHPAQRTAMVQRMTRTHTNSQIGRVIARSQGQQQASTPETGEQSQFQIALASLGPGAESILSNHENGATIQRTAIQRRESNGGGAEPPTPESQKDAIVELLASQPNLSFEEAAQIIAERHKPEEEEEEEGILGKIGNALESAWESATEFVADLFNDLFGWVTENKEEILLSVALVNPASAAIILSGWAWSEVLPILIEHAEAAWVQHVLPHLSYEQIGELLNSLEDSKLVAIINTMVLTGTLAPFIIAIGWDTAIVNKIVFAIPKAILQELAEIDRVGFVNWLGQKFDTIWPVGTAYLVTGKLGATFGYPIYLGAEGKEEAYRTDEAVYEFIKVGMLTVAADTGVGVGGDIQLGPIQATVSAKGELQGGLKFQASEHFEFPTGTDEALLPFLLEVAPLELTGFSQIIDPLIAFLPELSPDLYRKEFTVELNPFAAGAASAQAGVTLGGGDPEQLIQEGVEAGGEQKHGWLESLLPNALAMAGINLESGMGMSIYPDYEQEQVGIKLFANIANSVQGAGVIRGFKNILRAGFSLPLAYDFSGQLAVEGMIQSDGSIEWTGYEIEAESGVDNSGMEGVEASPGTGTKVTAEYDMEDEDGGEGTVEQEEDERSVADWLSDLAPDRVQVERRMGIGKGFGGARWLTDRRDYLNTLLPNQAGYREYGAMLEGLLIANFTLQKSDLEAIASWLGELATGVGDAQTTAQNMWTALQEFFQSGTLPEWMTDPSYLGPIFENISLSLQARYTVQLAAGADLSAAAGAKARIDVGATVARYTIIDLSQEAPEMVTDLLTFIGQNVYEFFSDLDMGDQTLSIDGEE